MAYINLGSYNIDGSSYSFVNLNLQGKELDLLGENFKYYQHLRYIDLSQNQLKDISDVVYIPHLLTLNASENQIENIDFFNTNPDSL